MDIKSAIKEGVMYAIIPARAGSKGVKNKNIRCVKGYPLLAYAIAAAKRCSCVSRILVSTDSEEYAKIARYYGAETPFLRPAEFAADNSPDIQFMEHAIGWLYENEGVLPEYFMHLRPTSPLREKSVVDRACELMLADPAATSLRSAHKQVFPPYKMFYAGNDGYFSCFIDGMTPDEANNPRQDFKQVYVPDGYVDILRTSHVVGEHLMHGSKVIAYTIEKSVDVDAKEDLDYLEFYMEKNRSELYEYLKERYKTLEEAF
ncbi:MAG: acylneuraminate cytidylyltransferase family protein [Lachnospiraceae bacterium]|nr:acylneuraminate cytidylyltransferase family protein [Lachnospiraceae bacterium]